MPIFTPKCDKKVCSNPHTQLKTAAGVIFFIGGINITLAIAAVVFQNEILLELGIGTFSGIFGLIFVGLGILVLQRNFVALLIAVLLFGIDAIFSIYYLVEQGSTAPTSMVVIRFLLLLAMLQGFKAMRTMKEQEGNK